MPQPTLRLALAITVLVSVSGCDQDRPPIPPPPLSAAELAEEMAAEPIREAPAHPPDLPECAALPDEASVDTVRRLTVAAFSEETRDLDFRAPYAVPVEDWTDIMSTAIPNGYNDFVATRVGAWLADFELLRLCPAREGSVAVYVFGPEETLRHVEAMLESKDEQVSSMEQGHGESLDHYIDRIAEHDSFGGPEEVMRRGDRLRLWWD